MIFWHPIFGGFRGVVPRNFGRQSAFAAAQLYKKLDFNVLWFRRKKAYKIKEEKKKKKKKQEKTGKRKKKKLIAAKSGFVGMKRFLKSLKTYYHVTIFLLVLEPFFNETAFYAKH